MAEEQLSRARFIKLSAALGVGAASASVLASCGGGSGGQGGGGAAEQQATDAGATGGVEGAPQASGETSGSANGGETQAPQGNAIASEGEVVPGTAAEFTAPSGDPAVLVHLENGDFVAYSAVCTHAQCTVAYNNGQLACPCHGSVFDPANGGAVVNPPANTPLPEIPVEVRDGQVYTA